MAKSGRPRIEIDKESFEKLCGLQCTLTEIAGFFNCSEDTIERWCKREYKMNFAEIFSEKRGKGKIALRRMQWQAAEAGSVPMQIFLGKNYLGQSDVQKIDANVTSLENEKSKLDEIIEQRKQRNAGK